MGNHKSHSEEAIHIKTLQEYSPFYYLFFQEKCVQATEIKINLILAHQIIKTHQSNHLKVMLPEF